VGDIPESRATTSYHLILGHPLLWKCPHGRASPYSSLSFDHQRHMNTAIQKAFWHLFSNSRNSQQTIYKRLYCCTKTTTWPQNTLPELSACQNQVGKRLHLLASDRSFMHNGQLASYQTDHGNYSERCNTCYY